MLNGGKVCGMRWIQRTAAATALACTLVCAVSAGYAASNGHDPVLAMIGSHKITEQQVDERLKDQLTTLKAEIYEVKKHAIDAMLAEYLLQQAADNSHLTSRHT